MMEALGEDVEATPVAAQSLVTEEMIVKALQEILPLMDAKTATLGVVMAKLALRFGVEKSEIKSQWKLRLRELLPDMLDLCGGGKKKEEEEAGSAEEEAVVRPSRKRAGTKRRAVSDESEEEDGNDAGEDEAQPEEDDEEDADSEEEEVAPKRRKRSSKEAHKAPVKRVRTATHADPPGLASLKELGRAAGVLNPRVYKLLKSASSTEEAEEILRDRLHDAGVSFSGSFPTSRDITAAKRKHDKDKELEGIDTSLIITGGRSRRSAARVSYKVSKEDEERAEGEEEEEEEEDDEDDEDASEGDFAASDSDSEATF